jgi:hypothetical protein
MRSSLSAQQHSEMDRKGRAVTFFILRGDLASVIRDYAADASNICAPPRQSTGDPHGWGLAGFDARIITAFTACSCGFTNVSTARG